MALVRVTRRAHFNAAHRLHNPAKSQEWNEATFGKCNSPNWHGHNYELEVTVIGEPHPDTGYVIDLADLKRIMNERVVDIVDHSNLNLDVPFLQGVMPSTENFAIAIWNRLVDVLPSGRLESVRLFETPRNYVEYRGE
ncbi:MAG: 6-carboxytetrahydropterin synthase [Rhodothermales bacterium]|nr:6-carboxytetrahydropterin synthase [Rhodothermales bacterium]MBO6778961.1 6-carboxytetrahydropterin synthase [Rhodothermales bacterium]